MSHYWAVIHSFISIPISPYCLFPDFRTFLNLFRLELFPFYTKFIILFIWTYFTSNKYINIICWFFAITRSHKSQGPNNKESEVYLSKVVKFFQKFENKNVNCESDT